MDRYGSQGRWSLGEVYAIGPKRRSSLDASTVSQPERYALWWDWRVIELDLAVQDHCESRTTSLASAAPRDSMNEGTCWYGRAARAACPMRNAEREKTTRSSPLAQVRAIRAKAFSLKAPASRAIAISPARSMCGTRRSIAAMSSHK